MYTYNYSYETVPDMKAAWSRGKYVPVMQQQGTNYPVVIHNKMTVNPLSGEHFLNFFP